MPDLRLDKNYACLAEFSWNTGAGSIPHYHIRYAEQTYSDQWRTALEAYDVAERIMGSYPVAVYVMDQLLHYFNNFPHGRVDYPLDLLRMLAGDPLAILTGIRIVAAHMQSAEQLLAVVESNLVVRDRFLLECRRYRTLAQAVLALLDGLRLVSGAQEMVVDSDHAAAIAQVEQAETLVAEAHNNLVETMRAMSQQQATYLQPSALRELSPLLAFLGDMREQLDSALAGEPAHVADLPLLAQFDLGRLRAVWHPWEF